MSRKESSWNDPVGEEPAINYRSQESEKGISYGMNSAPFGEIKIILPQRRRENK
jgi:hypothetical protein